MSSNFAKKFEIVGIYEFYLTQCLNINVLDYNEYIIHLNSQIIIFLNNHGELVLSLDQIKFFFTVFDWYEGNFSTLSTQNQTQNFLFYPPKRHTLMDTLHSIAFLFKEVSRTITT